MKHTLFINTKLYKLLTMLRTVNANVEYNSFKLPKNNAMHCAWLFMLFNNNH